MVALILRLLTILSTIAKYRLNEFTKDTPANILVNILLLPFLGLWFFSSARTKPKAERLRLALEELGPIYIKLGQLLSTRRDFLDPQLADELATLQDSVPPFANPTIEEIIDQELGESARNEFQSISQTPLASASIAQVYQASFKNGEKVVIKVVRPGIEKLVKSDLVVLKWLARLVDENFSIGKRLRPIEVIEDYEKIILDEMDLQKEAANTSELRRNFENSNELYVPKIYWDFVSKNLLVMEEINGIPVTNITELGEHKTNLKALAETGVNIFFTQVFEHNFFHADMHPGNIFVSKEKLESPQYIAIDCAIIGSLSESDQEYLAKNLLAIFRREYRKVAELHIASGWVPPHTKVAEFEAAIRSVCEPIFEKPLKEISFAQVLIQLFRTAGRFDMRVQPSLVLLQKTLLNVEGLGRQLYPDLDLWETAHPYLEQWQKSRLSPMALLSKIRDNLPELIEKLPEVPLLLAEATARQKEIVQSNAQLRNDLEVRDESERQRAKSRRWLALGFLVLGAISLVPEIREVATGLPLATTLLFGSAVYLLYFRA